MFSSAVPRIVDAVNAIRDSDSIITLSKDHKYSGRRKSIKRIACTSDNPEQWSLLFTTRGGSSYNISDEDILSCNFVREGELAMHAMIYPWQILRKKILQCLRPVQVVLTGERLRIARHKTDRIHVRIIVRGPVPALRELMHACNLEIFSTPKRTLVFVNPIAGKGRARSDWESIVKPLLHESGKFDLQCILTERSNHASEWIENLFCKNATTNPEELPEIIITVGGDGLVFEILNGLLNASRKVSGSDSGISGPLVTWLNKLLICPVPSGSGNGLAFSTLCLAGEAFTMNCALRQLVRLRTGRRDLGIVSFKDPDSRKSVEKLFALTISWGLVADVDVMSERLRMIGNARFTIYGLWKVIKKKLYRGVVHYGAGNAETDSPTEGHDYITVYASIVPVAGETVILNPTKPMDSGSISVYTLRGKEMTRIDLVYALEELGKRQNHLGRIRQLREVNVKDFELIPEALDDDDADGAGIVVDGERFTHLPVKAQILKNVTNCLV
jgi:diacylglycerol kinase family enzyme